MAMAFSKFRRNDQPIIADEEDYGIPSLSPEVVAAGQQKPANKFGVLDAVGIIGDALQSFNGGRGTYLPTVLAQRQRQQELDDAALQRQAQVQDWIAKQQWQRANPEPSSIERDVQAYQNLTPEQRQAFGELQDLRAGPSTVQLPNGFVYSGPRSGLGSALGGVVKPVGKLTPIDPRELGGGTGNGVGGF